MIIRAFPNYSDGLVKTPLKFGYDLVMWFDVDKSQLRGEI